MFSARPARSRIGSLVYMPASVKRAVLWDDGKQMLCTRLLPLRCLSKHGMQRCLVHGVWKQRIGNNQEKSWTCLRSSVQQLSSWVVAAYHALMCFQLHYSCGWPQPVGLPTLCTLTAAGMTRLQRIGFWLWLKLYHMTAAGCTLLCYSVFGCTAYPRLPRLTSTQSVCVAFDAVPLPHPSTVAVVLLTRTVGSVGILVAVILLHALMRFQLHNFCWPQAVPLARRLIATRHDKTATHIVS